MKAHIFKEPHALLLWQFPAGSAGYAGVLAAAEAAGLTVRHLADTDLGTRIADLCAGRTATADTPAPAVYYPTPALIVSGLAPAGGELNEFIDAVNAAGAAIPLKASATPTSRGWTLAHLLGELAEEHTALGGSL